MKLSNEIVINEAQKLGFDLVGFAEAKELSIEAERLDEWLFRGYQAGMDYMQRNVEKRKNIKEIFAEARSVISLGINYYSPSEHSAVSNIGKISRYAWGKDYHLIIWKKLDILIEKLKEYDASFKARSYIDTGPVMDKAWAVRSGIGWLGKHTNVINRDIGSWFFIANIISNFEFNYSLPIEDFCGSCTACLDACPTNAIVDEYLVDANKCISYLTIENKGEIPEHFSGKFDSWVFGCDICQDVCPWNHKFSKSASEPEFYPREKNKEIVLEEILNMEQKEFSERFRHSPVKRTKLSGLKRNAAFLAKESNQ